MITCYYAKIQLVVILGPGGGSLSLHVRRFIARGGPTWRPLVATNSDRRGWGLSDLGGREPVSSSFILTANSEFHLLFGLPLSPERCCLRGFLQFGTSAALATVSESIMNPPPLHLDEEEFAGGPNDAVEFARGDERMYRFAVVLAALHPGVDGFLGGIFSVNVRGTIVCWFEGRRFRAPRRRGRRIASRGRLGSIAGRAKGTSSSGRRWAR